MMSIGNDEKQQMSESIAFLNLFKEFGVAVGSLFNHDGAYWEIVNGAGGNAGAYQTIYFFTRTVWFNRMQRYGSRITEYSNAYAQTAVRQFMTLVRGPTGFKYISKDPGVQRDLDDWQTKNKWYKRQKESLFRYVVDGEVFYRLYDDKVRFVDPDQVYGDGVSSREDYFGGLLIDPEDDEEVKSYLIHKNPFGAPDESVEVPADEVQHRKNAHLGTKRGTSFLLPVLTDLAGIDYLDACLIAAGQVLSKVTIVRKNDSSQPAVAAMQAGINASRGNSGVWGQNGTSPWPPMIPTDRIPPGSIMDVSKFQDMDTLAIQDYGQFVNIKESMLKKVASLFCLSAGTYSNDRGDRGGYSSEIVHSSFTTRMIEEFQNDWKEEDLDLMQMCGLPRDKISVELPDVIEADRKAQKDLIEFELDRGLISDQAATQILGLDYEEQQEMIKKERAEKGGTDITTLKIKDPVDKESDT